MRRKHQRTLTAIFARPAQAGIKWADIEALFTACGAYVEERAGSRVYVELNDTAGHFHRPHPAKEAGKGTVDAVRRFLENAGMQP